MQRGEQRVSTTARSIMGIFTTILIVITILSAVGILHWLDFLNTCSYIKLAITLIKYVPQAVLNYRRKSTVGWSIGNILLDFTGGMLSMLQMMLNSYNYSNDNNNNYFKVLIKKILLINDEIFRRLAIDIWRSHKIRSRIVFRHV